MEIGSDTAILSWWKRWPQNPWFIWSDENQRRVGVIMEPAMAETGNSGHDAQVLEYQRLEKIKFL